MLRYTYQHINVCEEAEIELQHQQKTTDNIVTCYQGKDKVLLIQVVGKGCSIDRKTECVRGAIFHTFGPFTPSLREGVCLGCILYHVCSLFPSDQW